jgi:hypothetical protein
MLGGAVAGVVAAERATAALGSLKGGAQKLGQTLALAADAMPPEFRASLGGLFSEGQPRPWAEVREAVPDVVVHIEETPFAAASIGQVHRGALADGTPVAVKLLYPGVEQALRADLDNLSAATLPARLMEGSATLLVGLRHALLAELDLRTEAAHAEAMAEALAPWPRLTVAHPYFASERALVSAFLEGPTLHRVLPPNGPPLENPQELGDDVIAAVFGPVFRRGLVNADAHPGNLLVQPGGLGLIDFGAVAQVLHVAELDRALDAILEGRLVGAMAGLGFDVAGLDEVFAPILAPLGQGATDFADDALTRKLARAKQRYILRSRAIPFPEDRLPLLRALLGVHHVLRRLGRPFALGESLARVRATAKAEARDS